jgi:hypothetical protein
MKKHILRLILLTAIIAPVATALDDSAPCPYDGEQAPKISEEQVSISSCPGDGYNAVQGTYSHNHINGPFLERHTFKITECLDK